MVLIKETTFGEIGKRDIFILRVALEDRAEQLMILARKIKKAMENWNESGIELDLEDILWDICLFFRDCTICPVYFCVKQKIKEKEVEKNEIQ
jgi:hypothetical protein